MLISLRKHAKYFYILFGVVIVAFVFWVPGGLNEGEGNVVVAKVGDVEIGLMEFWTVFDNAENAWRQQKGKAPEGEEREQLKLDILAGLIHEAALLQVAEDEGIVVTDREIEEAIKSDRIFWQDGRFNPQLFDYLLRQNRMDRKFYISAKRREMTKNKVLSLADTVTALSPAEEKAVKDFGQPEATQEIMNQLLASKQDGVRLSFSEGMKADYFTTYKLDLIKDR